MAREAPAAPRSPAPFPCGQSTREQPPGSEFVERFRLVGVVDQQAVPDESLYGSLHEAQSRVAETVLRMTCRHAPDAVLLQRGLPCGGWATARIWRGEVVARILAQSGRSPGRVRPGTLHDGAEPGDAPHRPPSIEPDEDPVAADQPGDREPPADFPAREANSTSAATAIATTSPTEAAVDGEVALRAAGAAVFPGSADPPLSRGERSADCAGGADDRGSEPGLTGFLRSGVNGPAAAGGRGSSKAESGRGTASHPSLAASAAARPADCDAGRHRHRRTRWGMVSAACFALMVLLSLLLVLTDGRIGAFLSCVDDGASAVRETIPWDARKFPPSTTPEVLGERHGSRARRETASADGG